MKAVLLLLAGMCGALAACGQSDQDAATKATTNIAPPKKNPAFCFFKPEEMKGWAAKRGHDGNITLKGKAHVADPRYQAVLGPPSVTGSRAELSPTITPNTGYESPGDWWDVTAAIPNSAGVGTVVVTCGANSVAQLTVPPKS